MRHNTIERIAKFMIALQIALMISFTALLGTATYYSVSYLMKSDIHQMIVDTGREIKNIKEEITAP